ncbi:hypothetical protein [Streptomyces sp. NPDC048106]|uniref:hypothetical protein n=1 Tax=Streptomyces sp. NPDC048106 TaxID=3155750 RepID=UPI003453FB63
MSRSPDAAASLAGAPPNGTSPDTLDHVREHPVRGCSAVRCSRSRADLRRAAGARCRS